jgi:transcriptional regulator with XRE-family HTH domain
MLYGMADANELGMFLRSRREQLMPAQVGLRDAGRRRTPGLRREEVAALAGLSVDYLVRLEQGRDRNPSVQVINALANALLLDPDERLHLGQLAACAASPGMCPSGSGTVDEVPATVRALLDRLHPTPAVVVGPWWQVVAYNRAWERIMGPVGALDGPEPNLVRFTFLDPRSRVAYPDWSQTADEQVAVLREAKVRWRHDERLPALITDLEAVPEFAERWQAHEVARKRRGTKIVVHPRAGPLRIDFEVLLLNDDTDQRMITWLPGDEATTAAFDRLCADATAATSPPHLRVVG